METQHLVVFMHSGHFSSGSRQPLVGGIRRLSWDFQVKKWRLNYLGLILASAFRLEMETELQNMTAQPVETHDSLCSLHWLLGGVYMVLFTLGFLKTSHSITNPSWGSCNEIQWTISCNQIFSPFILLCDLRICWRPTGLLGTINGLDWAISQQSRWSVLDVMPSTSASMAVV